MLAHNIAQQLPVVPVARIRPIASPPTGRTTVPPHPCNGWSAQPREPPTQPRHQFPTPTRACGSSPVVGSSRKHHPRLVHHRSRDREPPPISAGQGLGPAVGKFLQTELFEQMINALRKPLKSPDGNTGRFGPDSREPSDPRQSVVLRADSKGPARLVTRRCEVMSRDPDGSLIRTQETMAEPQRRRLTAPLGPRSPTTSPARQTRSTPSTTRFPPGSSPDPGLQSSEFLQRSDSSKAET